MITVIVIFIDNSDDDDDDDDVGLLYDNSQKPQGCIWRDFHAQ